MNNPAITGSEARCNPVVATIVWALNLRDRALYRAAFACGFRLAVPSPEQCRAEDRALHALALRLLRAGFSHAETAVRIKDLAGQIYLLALQEPVDRRGAAWFCKGGLLHRAKGRQILRSFLLPSGNRGTAAELAIPVSRAFAPLPRTRSPRNA